MTREQIHATAAEIADAKTPYLYSITEAFSRPDPQELYRLAFRQGLIQGMEYMQSRESGVGSRELGVVPQPLDLIDFVGSLTPAQRSDLDQTLASLQAGLTLAEAVQWNPPRSP